VPNGNTQIQTVVFSLQPTPYARATGATGTGLPNARVCGYCVAGLYREERNHQGVGNRLIDPVPQDNSTGGAFRNRTRLGEPLAY